jgi:D-glycero-D-manno-heptose 1,7-bisphosphate phosphatase
VNKAVFFDRDGTLIRSVHYLNKPDQVEIVDGVVEVLRMLEREGYLRIVVTNQAAIGKGLLTELGLKEIHRHIGALLEKQGTTIDAWYHCPEIRISDDPETIDHPDRKPGPGMLLRAGIDHCIALEKSWMVGDTLSDAVAGHNAGCRGSILVAGGLFQQEFREHPCVDFVAETISEIPQIILYRDKIAHV